MKLDIWDDLQMEVYLDWAHWKKRVWPSPLWVQRSSESHPPFIPNSPSTYDIMLWYHVILNIRNTEIICNHFYRLLFQPKTLLKNRREEESNSWPPGRKEFMLWFVTQTLDVYQVTFKKGEEAASLEHIDRRFDWLFRRGIPVYENEHSKVGVFTVRDEKWRGSKRERYFRKSGTWRSFSLRNFVLRRGNLFFCNFRLRNYRAHFAK